MTGVIRAAALIGTSVSNILLPMMFPTDRWTFFFMIAATEIAISGRLVPRPMIRTEIIASLISNVYARLTTDVTVNSDPPTSADNPMTILWIAIPLALQTVLIFAITYLAARFLGLSYENAAPAAMIGASNHFEVAIATAVILFGLGSGAALATVVGVLIEVPLMLALVGFCKKTSHWFPAGQP